MRGAARKGGPYREKGFLSLQKGPISDLGQECPGRRSAGIEVAAHSGMLVAKPRPSHPQLPRSDRCRHSTGIGAVAVAAVLALFAVVMCTYPSAKKKSLRSI